MAFYGGSYVKSRAGRGKKTAGVLTKKQLRELEFEHEKLRLEKERKKMEGKLPQMETKRRLLPSKGSIWKHTKKHTMRGLIPSEEMRSAVRRSHRKYRLKG